MRSLIFLILIFISTIVHASISVYNKYEDLEDDISSRIIIENWSSFPVNTVLEGQIINGISYNSSSSNSPLLVGSPHGASWLLGYLSEDGVGYRSFSTETLTFNFSPGINFFGVSLSQGNQSGNSSYDGFSVWDISLDDQYVATARADYGFNDFTGEAFLGLSNLNSVNKVDIRRMFSTANIVWDIRDISYLPASEVPLPAGIYLFLSGLVGLGLMRGGNA